MLDRLSKLPRKTPDNLFLMAITYEYLVERDTALYYLEEALKNGLTLSKIEVSAWLDDLKADARYQALIKRYIHETKEAND